MQKFRLLKKSIKEWKFKMDKTKIRIKNNTVNKMKKKSMSTDNFTGFIK